MRTQFDISEFWWEKGENHLISHETFLKEEICSRISIEGRTKTVLFAYSRFLDNAMLCEFYPMWDEDKAGVPIVLMRFKE